METNELKQRHPKSIPGLSSDLRASVPSTASEPRPTNEAKHGALIQLLRMLLFATWFNACCVWIHTTQLLGTPLYLINKDYYYAWMALTKQSFGIVIITITQWFSPSLVRASGNASVLG